MSSKTSSKTRAWKHSRRAAWRKVAGEAVILDVDTAVYYSLDGAGLRIWELIEKRTPVDRIHRTLCEEYDAAPGRLRKDLDRLILKLKKAKIIEPA